MATTIDSDSEWTLSQTSHFIIETPDGMPNIYPSLSLSGLDTPNPLMQLGQDVYQGETKMLLGTLLVFEPDQAEFITTVDRAIVMHKMNVVKK